MPLYEHFWAATIVLNGKGNRTIENYRLPHCFNEAGSATLAPRPRIASSSIPLLESPSRRSGRDGRCKPGSRSRERHCRTCVVRRSRRRTCSRPARGRTLTRRRSRNRWQRHRNRLRVGRLARTRRNARSRAGGVRNTPFQGLR